MIAIIDSFALDSIIFLASSEVTEELAFTFSSVAISFSEAFSWLIFLSVASFFAIFSSLLYSDSGISIVICRESLFSQKKKRWLFL